MYHVLLVFIGSYKYYSVLYTWDWDVLAVALEGETGKTRLCFTSCRPPFLSVFHLWICHCVLPWMTCGCCCGLPDPPSSTILNLMG
jgi:hypothetical protein